MAAKTNGHIDKCMSSLFTRKGAFFSPCQRYRYSLTRLWGQSPGPTSPDERLVMFIMLNPSTADEYRNDPTVERCERRARDWGYDGLIVCNLFAWRSTDPGVLKTLDDPVGPDNDWHIQQNAQDASLIVCAWGKDGELHGRGNQVADLLRHRNLTALKVSDKTGQPWHPLYLNYDLKPTPWKVLGNVSTET